LFYLKDWVEAFQIVQEDYKKVRVFIVPRDVINESEKREIENKIKLVMEQDCVVNWEFVEKIPKTQSGKYLYTKSLLYQA
jgi:phenylacetate-CoA ligase